LHRSFTFLIYFIKCGFDTLEIDSSLAYIIGLVLKQVVLVMIDNECMLVMHHRLTLILIVILEVVVDLFVRTHFTEDSLVVLSETLVTKIKRLLFN
jgi:hypothetical protein